MRNQDDLLPTHAPASAPSARSRVPDLGWQARRRWFRVIAAALRIGGDRFNVRVIEFSVQGNHIHLLVEAPDRRALARAIQGLSIRVAKGLNRMMGRSGRVFDDRYHARVLRTPTEVRHAIHYVLGNARKHAAERGEAYPPE